MPESRVTGTRMVNLGEPVTTGSCDVTTSAPRCLRVRQSTWRSGINGTFSMNPFEEATGEFFAEILKPFKGEETKITGGRCLQSLQIIQLS